MTARSRGTATRQPAVETLCFQLRVAGIKGVWTEVQFHPKRKWRLDVLIGAQDRPSMLPDRLNETPLAVEVDGGGYVVAADGKGGRHSRGRGMESDCEKYAEAMKLGYRILRVTPKHVKSGQALAWIEDLLR